MHIIRIAVHIEKLTNAHYLLPNFLELKEAISLFFIMGNDHGKIFAILKFSRNLLLSWFRKRKLNTSIAKIVFGKIP